MVLQLFRMRSNDGVAATLLIGASCLLQGCTIESIDHGAVLSSPSPPHYSQTPTAPPTPKPMTSPDPGLTPPPLPATPIPASLPAPATPDVYEYVGAPDVGEWGGKCRCPSGNIYEVGDNYDSCGSIACNGGEVVEQCGHGVISPSRAGWRVTCGNPGPPTPPPPPGSYPNGPIKVVCLNLADGQGVSQGAIAPTVGGQMPADLLGFQEPRGWLTHMSFKDSDSLEWYQSDEKHWPHTNPAPIAWNKHRFEVLDKGHEEVARDGCGARVLELAKLKDRASGKIILFANTHGPVGGVCGWQTSGWEYDKNMADAIKKKREDAEVVIVTGDFNTGSGTLAKVREIAGNVIEGNWGIDMIISNDNVECHGGAFDGGPSDHDGVHATCNI